MAIVQALRSFWVIADSPRLVVPGDLFDADDPIVTARPGKFSEPVGDAGGGDSGTHTHTLESHTHPYAPTGHTHDLTHSHTAAEVGAATSAHTHPAHDHDSDYAAAGHAHDTTHNHDAAYAPTHSHPYAGTSHSHVDADLPAGLARDAEVTSAIATHAATPHGGGGSSSEKAVVVGSDVANTSNTTAVNAISTVDLGTGTYLFKAWVAWKTAATTTGIEMWANHTGTVTRFVSTWYTLTTGGAAATGVADQATTLTAQMIEGKGQRVKDTASGPIQGTDTANADQFAVMEGIAIVTATGNFEIKFRSEVNGSAATVLTGTTLELRKVA